MGSAAQTQSSTSQHETLSRPSPQVQLAAPTNLQGQFRLGYVLPVDDLALHVVQPHPQVEVLIVQPQLCTAGHWLLLLLLAVIRTAAVLLPPLLLLLLEAAPPPFC